MKLRTETNEWAKTFCHKDRPRACSTVRCTAWAGDREEGFCMDLYGHFCEPINVNGEMHASIYCVDTIEVKENKNDK